jgi:hypothetical protein
LANRASVLLTFAGKLMPHTLIVFPVKQAFRPVNLHHFSDVRKIGVVSSSMRAAGWKGQ